jgi:hypothetical protein
VDGAYERRETVWAVVHPGYSGEDSTDHDVALLLLDKPSIQPAVKLASPFCCSGCKRGAKGCVKPDRVPIKGNWLTSIGFGRLNDEPFQNYDPAPLASELQEVSIGTCGLACDLRQAARRRAHSCVLADPAPPSRRCSAGRSRCQ